MVVDLFDHRPWADRNKTNESQLILNALSMHALTMYGIRLIIQVRYKNHMYKQKKY
jgi:hypothetical protein